MKNRLFLLLCMALLVLISCQTQQKQTPLPEAGLYKISILYPGGAGKTFDMDYYRQQHMPMVAGFLGKNLQLYEIDKGVSGRTPKDSVPFVAVGYFYCKNMEEYHKAIALHIDTIMADIRKYTNIQPVIQVSQIEVMRKGSSE